MFFGGCSSAGRRVIAVFRGQTSPPYEGQKKATTDPTSHATRLQAIS